MKRNLAYFISRIFDPFFEIPLLLGLTVWFAHLNGLSLRFLTTLIFVDALLPGLFFIHLLRKGEVSDWDISKRKERIQIYGFTLMSHLAGVLLSMFVGHTHTAGILFVFWLLGIFFFLITLFWKISMHAGVNAALATFLTLSGGYKYVLTYLILFPVGWARVYLKKHSLAQFVAGAVLAAAGLWIGFYCFGLI